MEMTSMLYCTIYAVQRINPRAFWMPGSVVAWRDNHHNFHGNYQKDGRIGRGEWPGEGKQVPRRTLLWSLGSCLCFDVCLVWLFFQPLRQGPWCVLELLSSTSLDAHVTEGTSRRDRTGVIPTVPCLMLVHPARTPINSESSPCIMQEKLNIWLSHVFNQNTRVLAFGPPVFPRKLLVCVFT